MSRVKLMLKFVIVILLMGPFSIHAKEVKPFSSKSNLLKKLFQLGFDHMYEIKYSQKMKILVLNEDGTYHSQQVKTYNDILEVPRVPEMDYFGKNNYRVKAYKIGEAMLCYQSSYFSVMIGKVLPESMFSTCYTFPSKISKIIEAISN